MNTAVEEAINRQLNAELDSAYLYLSMSAHFASEGLPGSSRSWSMSGRSPPASTPCTTRR